MTTEQDIAALREDVQAAQERGATAKARLAQAQARAEAARDDLQNEFGVTTADEARTALAELRQQLEAEAAEVRARLRQAGGTA